MKVIRLLASMLLATSLCVGILSVYGFATYKPACISEVRPPLQGIFIFSATVVLGIGSAIFLRKWRAIFFSLIAGVLLLYVITSLYFSRISTMKLADQQKLKVAIVGQSLGMYHLHCQRFPLSLQELITSPGDSCWKGPYIEGEKISPATLLDGCGREIRFQSDGKTAQFVFAGFDMEYGTSDDTIMQVGSQP